MRFPDRTAPRPGSQGLPVIELTEREFARLLDYSHSLPSGTTIGKRWKRCLFLDNLTRDDWTNWVVGEYTRESVQHPGEVDITWYAPELEGSVPTQEQVDGQMFTEFTTGMKLKLALSVGKGRSGWHKPEECPVTRLWDMLDEHIRKSNLDMRDVGNLAGMIQYRLKHVPGDREVLAAHVAAQEARP